MVIAGRPLTDLFPLQWARKGLLISQLDMYSVEDLGPGQDRPAGPARHRRGGRRGPRRQRTQGISVDLSKLPDDDPATRRLMRTGDTMGCFYIESPGMRSLLKKLKADTFAVVVAASSVIRPGPSDSGMSRSFVLRHLGKEKPVLPHPALGFLNETYGVMIYQEDVMRTLSAVAGLTLAEADLMRRAMSFKGDPQEFLAMQDRFLAGAHEAIAAGRTPQVDDEVLDELWRQISSFAGYAFCKAHSASYAVLSFQAAWLKAHHPGRVHGRGDEQRRRFLQRRRPTSKRPAGWAWRSCCRTSTTAGTSSPDRPPGAHRPAAGPRHEPALAWTRCWTSARPTASSSRWATCCSGCRSSRENEVENLIRCGACDGFELTRPELLWRHALIRKERQGRPGPRTVAGKAIERTTAVTVQTATLFPVGGTAPGGGSAVSLVPAIPDYSPTEKLQQEMEVLHLTATGHPMAVLRAWLQERGVIPARDLGGLRRAAGEGRRHPDHRQERDGQADRARP